MVIFNIGDFVGKAEGRGDLDLVLRLVRPVPALALAFYEFRRRQRAIPRYLLHIVENTVLIAKILCFEFSSRLIAEAEGDAGVHNGLPAQDVLIILSGDVYVGENVHVRLPADGGAGLFPVGGAYFKLLTFFAADLAFFEVQLVLVPVPPHGHVHIL